MTLEQTIYNHYTAHGQNTLAEALAHMAKHRGEDGPNPSELRDDMAQWELDADDDDLVWAFGLAWRTIITERMEQLEDDELFGEVRSALNAADHEVAWIAAAHIKHSELRTSAERMIWTWKR